MARKAILSETQCKRVRTLYENGSRAIELAKRFGVSESSLYKVLDGSYHARPNGQPVQEPLPVVAPDKPDGITPSLFDSTTRAVNQETQAIVKRMLEKARQIDDVELDDLTVAAAELIVAKARLNRVLAHVH